MKYIKKFENNRIAVLNELKDKFIDCIHFGSHDTEDVLDMLLKYNINVNYYDSNADVPLIVATWYNREELVKKLLDVGANPNMQYKNTDDTALTIAAKENNYNIIVLLIEAGADWTIKDNKGFDFVDLVTDDYLEILKEDYPDKYQDYKMKKDVEKYNL